MDSATQQIPIPIALRKLYDPVLKLTVDGYSGREGQHAFDNHDMQLSSQRAWDLCSFDVFEDRVEIPLPDAVFRIRDRRLFILFVLLVFLV